MELTKRQPWNHTKHTGRSASLRDGAMLLELIVSIFVLAVVVIPASQYVTNALRASEKTQSSVRTALLCEAKVNEILAGASGFRTNASGVFESAPDLRWQLTVSQTPVDLLQQVSVTVQNKETSRTVAQQVVFVFQAEAAQQVP